jgi:hypothetical protein
LAYAIHLILQGKGDVNFVSLSNDEAEISLSAMKRPPRVNKLYALAETSTTLMYNTRAANNSQQESRSYVLREAGLYSPF